MFPKAYLETTIISYLTAWRSPELVMAANQEATRQWWEEYRGRYELFVSEIVVREASAGDPDAASRRLAIVSGLPELAIIEEASDLADALIQRVPLPERAQLDALHIALAAVHGMDYLLTWNCRHIANATLRHGIEATCRECGFASPVICTPLELMEQPPMDDPIVEEVRKARDEYARQFDYDLKAICRDLRERQNAGGRQVVSFVTKPRQQELSESGQ